MEKWYVVHCKGKYLEDGIDLMEFTDYEEVNIFLSEKKIGNPRGTPLWVFHGKLFGCEEYQVETKMRIKMDGRGEPL